MKNLNYISALLFAAALATSCSNEEIAENGATTGDFTLVATTGANTRTSVSADETYTVNWTAGDAFYAFGTVADEGKHIYNATAKFNLQSGATTTAGTFKGTVGGQVSELQYAVYPLGSYDSGAMKVEFPENYTYPNSNAPMFGKVDGSKKEVEFTQLLCGMMRIKVHGLDKNASGKLILAGANIAGKAELKIDENGTASVDPIGTGTNTVEMAFTNSKGEDPLFLDIPIPAGTYTEGITATMEIGGATSDPFKTTTGLVIKNGVIENMREFNDVVVEGNTVSFTKEVATAADAITALKEGSKDVTINTVSSASEFEIPSSKSPVRINIKNISTNSITVKPTTGSSVKKVYIDVPEGSQGTLTVENIDHVEISGGWKKVTASTGDNTFVVKADAVIEDLTVEKGNIEIKSGGVVNKLTLNNDVTINNALDIPAGEEMEIILGTHTLTFAGDYYTRIYEGSKLTLTGDESARGNVIDNTYGIAALVDAAKFTMKNVNYINENGDCILVNKNVSNTVVTIDNSIVTCNDYCINTNAKATVGSSNTITPSNSTFTAVETALMVNIPATVTATDCTFTGGWQGAMLRGGTFTFTNCGFNLSVTDHGSSSTAAGAFAWGDGNKVPSAAITAGNRTRENYDYKTTFSLENCTFSVTNSKDEATYPSIYIDAEKDKESQGVTFNYDNASKISFDDAGEGLDIREKTGKVMVNSEPYEGSNAPE